MQLEKDKVLLFMHLLWLIIAKAASTTKARTTRIDDIINPLNGFGINRIN